MWIVQGGENANREKLTKYISIAPHINKSCHSCFVFIVSVLAEVALAVVEDALVVVVVGVDMEAEMDPRVPLMDQENHIKIINLDRVLGSHIGIWLGWQNLKRISTQSTRMLQGDPQ